MKAVLITLIISIAVMFCSFCFTNQHNESLYVSQSGAMVVSPNRGDI